MQLSKLVSSALSAFALSSAAIAGSSTLQSSSAAPGDRRAEFINRILTQAPQHGDSRNLSSSSGEKLKVGIIGAGAAGLYAAVLLDTLDIDYEILESSERIGGRIFTHRFDQKAWDASRPGQPDYYDYYDVGAMRIPGVPYMDRLIGKANNSLVNYINSKLKPEYRPVKLVPYMYQRNNTFRLFNDKLAYNQVTPSADTFDIPVSGGGTMDNNTFAAMSPSTMFSGAVKDLVQALDKDFDSGFNMLLQFDDLSVRQHLLNKGYSSQQVDWLETIYDATTHYDIYSVAQVVIEQWLINESPLDTWLCVEGGMDLIIKGMVNIIKKTVETRKRVTAIKQAGNGAIAVVINGTEQRTYNHVINTVPLGAMQAMDLTDMNLDYRAKLAIRKIQYDPAGKIGMKFKTRWWESLSSGPFQGGQSFTDLPIRRSVYPSYGINTPGAAGTMIASYTWGQDSARLGAYYNQQDSRETIIEITLRNLAQVHNVTYEFLQSQHIDTHVYNWYEGEHELGAFAKFGPGQYVNNMPVLMRPAAAGKLHFAGEALSSGHAWIVGALNSAYRTVTEVLATEAMDQKLVKMVDTWGLIDNVDMGWYSHEISK
ncbi:hypothetical protein HIM_06689 [Hirsutella minnesotensis 3608]|uniref:Amine oxidase domain-containing protein n=1 Tax=Hirsutella minnesotensis 3608 TaxID=1043627 RepID=A0A0F7ZIV7_9HYPO|nr:hypothetical protein HIM_06689 [Hirsutella minnesotensis 3608]